jgi:glycosyltransferase 2 family protein
LKARKILIRLGQLLLVFVLGYYLIYRNLVLNWESLAETRWRIAWVPFSGSLIAVSLVYVVNSQIWRGIVRSFSGVELSRFRAAYIWFVSNLGRYLPGKIWQIAGMAVLARMWGVPAMDATASAVVGQVIHLLAGAAVGLLFFPGELPEAYLPLVRWAWLALPLVLVFLYPPLLNKLLSLATRFSGKQSVSCNLKTGHLLVWFLLNVVVWLAYGACFYYFILSVLPGSDIELATAVGVYAVGYIIGFLVIFAPGGIGVREFLFVGLLISAVGGKAPATVVALASRIWLSLAELVPLAVVLLVGGLPAAGSKGDKSETD